MATSHRVEIGFDGGQVMPVRLSDEQLKQLKDELQGGGRWQELATDDGTLAVDLAKVVFVRIASNDPKVAF